VRKVQSVVIQGGVKEFTAGQAPPGSYLEPDSAHNNMFDAKASAFFYRRCQELGVPMVVLSRFTAYAAPVPRSIYDEMAATGSPIGNRLQKAQRKTIEALWVRACAPEGSAVRAGLPARCTREWFCNTFCNGLGKDRTGEQSIWDCIQQFNMYDPLALVAAIPKLQHVFDPDAFVVNGVTHRVVGTSKERPGITDGETLKRWLYNAFMQGVRRSAPHQDGWAMELRETDRAIHHRAALDRAARQHALTSR